MRVSRLSPRLPLPEVLTSTRNRLPLYLFFVSFVSIGNDEFFWATHKPLGFLLFVLIFIRIVWMVATLSQRPKATNIAAKTRGGINPAFRIKYQF